MNWYTINFNICGTARVAGENDADACRQLNELYPVCIDVHDRSWFDRSDSVSISDGMTVISPVIGQELKLVSEAATRIGMRPSVRGEKAFWVPRARLASDREYRSFYSMDIAIVATAFI